jgi:hypothetical protein
VLWVSVLEPSVKSMIKMETVPEFANVRIAAFLLDKAITSMQ